MRRSNRLLGCCSVLLFLGLASNAHAQFGTGDVFVAVANGQVQWRSPSGALIQTLNTGQGGFTTGMAFDAADALYVTNFSASSVSKFNNNGVLQGLFGTGYSTPESILFDQAGDAYVGNLGNGIRKYNSAGTFLGSSFTGRVDWIDLSADQCTMLYTQEGTSILRHNVCTNTALTNFANGLGGNAFALRIRANGEVLLANGVNVLRLNSSGTVIQTYDVAGQDCWFALNLNPDGTTFWSADFCTANVYKIDIATGAVVTSFNTGTGSSTVFGLAVNGEFTVSICANNVPPSFVSPTPTCGSTINGTVNNPVSFTVSASDVNAGQSVTLSATGLPAGSTMTPALPTVGNPVQSVFNWTPTSPGVTTVVFKAKDECGDSVLCSLSINVTGGAVDPNPPSCNVTGIIPGPPKQVQITVQDAQSGLASISVLTAINCNVNIPSFTVGTTSPVVVTATKINQSAGSTVILRATDVAGNSTSCDPVYTTLSAEVPTAYQLKENFPNPFNPTTRIDFSVAKSEDMRNVSIKVYDLLGREVRTLINEPMQAGVYSVEWDGRNDAGAAVTSGVYLYRMVAGDFVSTRRMTLMK